MLKKKIYLISFLILSAFTLVSCNTDSTSTSDDVSIEDITSNEDNTSINSSEIESESEGKIESDAESNTSNNEDTNSSDESSDLADTSNTTDDTIDNTVDNSSDDIMDTSSNNTSEDLQIKAEALFTDAVSTLYNTDYSLDENKNMAKDFINKNFTDNFKEKMLTDINDYTSEISTSDFAITFIEDVTPTDSAYNKVFSVRYNVTVLIDKPTIYSDLYGTVIVTDSNEVLIESLYDYKF